MLRKSRISIMILRCLNKTREVVFHRITMKECPIRGGSRDRRGILTKERRDGDERIDD